MYTYENVRRWRRVSITFAVLLLAMGCLLIWLQTRNAMLQAANNNLSAMLLGKCAAVGVGDMAFNTIDLDGATVCLHFSAPPNREQWQKRNDYTTRSKT